jgi:hypothetical protein
MWVPLVITLSGKTTIGFSAVYGELSSKTRETPPHALRKMPAKNKKITLICTLLAKLSESCF